MWMSLGNPAPRSTPTSYTPLLWPTAASIALPVPVEDALADLATTLQTRRTSRAFGPVPLAALGALLWHTARCQRTAASGLGFLLEQRPTPSAGAIHPIHLVLQLPGERAWCRYNARTHQLDVLPGASGVLSPLMVQCQDIVALGAGQLVLFVAEPGMTAAKYDYPESLVWRDAGVLQGVLSITAAALGLNLCLLGVTGDPWGAQLAQQGQLMGVGVAVLGSRP